MKIASYHINKYSREFKNPWVTSKGIYTHREGIIISIKTAEGVLGFGEASPLPGYSSIDLKSVELTLNEIMTQLTGVEISNNLKSISSYASQNCNSNSICRFALESALCDAASREKELPLNKWINPDARSKVSVNYLIGQEVEDWGAVSLEIAKGGYQAVKIKVGRDPQEDIERVKKIRGELKDNISIRLDANQGWTQSQAIHTLNQLRTENIDYIEEPIENPDGDKLKTLKESTDCPIALDESLSEVFGPRNAILENICDVLILKPSQIGSFSGIIDLYNLAQLNNCRVVLTSTLETEIGIAAQLHLVSCLGDNIQPCGYDTLRLFKDADSSLSLVQDGFIHLPPENGIGYAGKD